jgi:hypothetical protein
MAANDTDNAKAAKTKADAEAAAAARARAASGETEATNEAKPVVVARTAEAEAESQRNRRGAKEQVMVGCKLPHGLTIQLNRKTVNDEGKTIWQPFGKKVTLAGRNASQIVGGFGMTSVDADFWDAWVEQNPTFRALENGLLFAEPRRDRAMDRAIDQKEAKSGSEPIDPDKPGKGLTKVSAEDQKRAAAMGDA